MHAGVDASQALLQDVEQVLVRLSVQFIAAFTIEREESEADRETDLVWLQLIGIEQLETYFGEILLLLGG